MGESKKCLIGKKYQLVFFKSHIELFSKFEVADEKRLRVLAKVLASVSCDMLTSKGESGIFFKCV